MFKEIKDYFFSKKQNSKYSYNEITSLEDDWGRDTNNGNRPFSGASVQDFIKSHLDKPLHQVYDGNSRLMRYFGEKQWADACKALIDQGEPLSAEVLEHQAFTATAPAPYSVSVTIVGGDKPILEGTTGTYLDCSWRTTNDSGVELQERVDVIITFTNNGTSKQIRNTYGVGRTAHILVDDYLTSGQNEITVVVSGQTSGETGRSAVVYSLVSMGLSSSFNVAQSLTPDVDGVVQIPVNYTAWGGYDKFVEFAVDGTVKTTKYWSSTHNPNESAAAPDTETIAMTLTPGKHKLQVRMHIEYMEQDFYTDTLGYEFVVTGTEQEHVTIAYLNPIEGEIVLQGEQYKTVTVTWGYYTSNTAEPTSTVEWRLRDPQGNYVILGSRNATTLDATNNIAPDPLKFIPDSSGEYYIEAWVSGTKLSEYRIVIAANTMGIQKQAGAVLDLSATGRSNDEPSDVFNTWVSGNYSAVFHGTHRWENDALVIEGAGNYVDFDISAMNMSPSSLGATIEVTFETMASDDETVPVFTIGNNSSSFVYIYSKKAMIKSTQGSKVQTKYNNNEKQKIAFIVNSYRAETEPCLMFLQTDGVRERATQYVSSDNFGSITTLRIGDTLGRCGIKVYSIRIYNKALTHDQEFQNFLVDSGDNISALSDKNDIFDAYGRISMDKLTGKVDVIKVEGPVNLFFGNTGDAQITANFERVSVDPYDALTVEKMTMKNPGQSTRGFGISQQRGYTDKDNCVPKDYDGKTLRKGFYALQHEIDGKQMIPEKKFRLNPQFVDSSMGLAAAFFHMVNKTSPNVMVDGEHVLRYKAQDYAIETYESVVGKPFPYKILNVPNPIPAVEFWRTDSTEDYSYLSQFTLSHEKKSPRSFGQRSIYNKVLSDGTPDPFDLYDGTKGERLWDNSKCLQFEILQNADNLAMFTTMDGWDTPQDDGNPLNEHVFEQIYPDTDDITPEEATECRNTFKNGFVKKLVDCYTIDNGGPLAKAEFQRTASSFLDLPKWADYRIKMLKNMLVDNVVRNLEACTDDGIHWYPRYWDVDIQFGVRNDGPLVFDPGIDRQSLDPENLTAYAFAGHGSWLWDALESWTWFTNVLTPKVNQALIQAGWTRSAFIKEFESFIDTYPERLYNESMQSKYINQGKANGVYSYLPFAKGRMKQYIRYMVAENYTKWDADWCSGEYTGASIYLRCQDAPRGKKMYFKAAKDFTFGWALTNEQNLQQIGVHVQRGETFTFEIKSEKLGINDPVVIYGPNAIEEADFHEIARYFSATLQFGKTYDADMGTNLKKLNVGISKEEMRTTEVIPTAWDDEGNVTATSNIPVRNLQSSIQYEGIDTMSRLEEFNVQGMAGMSGAALSGLTYLVSLKKFYAAGANLTSFTPANNVTFEELELPNRVQSIEANNVNWNSLVWYDDNINVTTVPNTLVNITFRNVGTSASVKNLITSWANAFDTTKMYQYQLMLTNVHWTHLTYEFLTKLASIPASQRNITGYLEVDDELDSNKMSQLMLWFGDNIFNGNAPLRISTSHSTFVMGIGGDAYYDEDNECWCLLAGHSAKLSAVAFPVSYGQSMVWTIQGLPTSDVVSYKTVSLDTTRAVVSTVESNDDDYFVTFVATNGSSPGYLTVKIVKRKYPTAVRIQPLDNSGNPLSTIGNSFYINSYGYHLFRALFTVDGAENAEFKKGGTGVFGSMRTTNGYQWDYSDESGMSVRCEIKSHHSQYGSDEYLFCMHVTGLPEGDVSHTLKYLARFQNYQTVTAEDLIVTLYQVFRVIGGLSDELGGNQPLFECLKAHGIQVDPNNQGYITNETMRQWSGALNISNTTYNIGGIQKKVSRLDTIVMKPEGGTTTRTNVIQYIGGLTGISVKGSDITQTLDLRKNINCASVDSEGRPCGLKIGDEPNNN